jgi:hypothetical protein
MIVLVLWCVKRRFSLRTKRRDSVFVARSDLKLTRTEV